jgi:hypothetical protein
MSETLSTLSTTISNLFAQESWNQKRTSDQLQSFVSRRLENCLDESEFDVEV